MPTQVFMAKLGMTMTEGTVAEWFVTDGGSIEAGQSIYRVETEKIDMEIESESTGTVRHIVPVDTTLEPGEVVALIYTEGEEIPDKLPGTEAAQPSGIEKDGEVTIGETTSTKVIEDKTKTKPKSDGARVPATPAARKLAEKLGVNLSVIAGSGPRGRITETDVQSAANSNTQETTTRINASPVAKRLAKQLDINLSSIQGSGARGRITKEDVEAAANSNTPTPTKNQLGPQAGESIPVKGMRKVIAQRMHASLQESAQLTMDMEVAMDNAVQLRNQLVEEWAQEGVKPSYTDLVIAASAKALAEHPFANATFSETEIHLLNDIHIGMAVALEEGLVVPVIQDVNNLSIKEIAKESARLAKAAREGQLGMDEMTGGTFTVTALGMFGVDSFTPIINSPEVGILGVNRIRDNVKWDGDRPTKQQTMTLSLTWDHRAIDGAPAAQFLGTIKGYLESPYRLLI
jgi:pyruvate/2-oxoglutarate dehydrogenase complex dihydrolipoamide acyltransferase (E2) component